jgi:hypothetical protein
LATGSDQPPNAWHWLQVTIWLQAACDLDASRSLAAQFAMSTICASATESLCRKSYKQVPHVLGFVFIDFGNYTGPLDHGAGWLAPKSTGPRGP